MNARCSSDFLSASSSARFRSSRPSNNSSSNPINLTNEHIVQMSTWHSWAGASCVDAIARLISQEYRREFLALVDSIWIPNARKNRNASRSGSRVLWGFKIQNPPREFPGGWRSAESVTSLAHRCHEGMVVTIESLEWRSGSLENLTIRCPSDLRDDA